MPTFHTPRQLPSAAVADHATGLDIERDVAHRHARLVAQAGGKLEKALDVGEVGGYPERHADGNIWTSIDHNEQRFNLTPQLAAILRNTAKEMGW